MLVDSGFRACGSSGGARNVGIYAAAFRVESVGGSAGGRVIDDDSTRASAEFGIHRHGGLDLPGNGGDFNDGYSYLYAQSNRGGSSGNRNRNYYDQDDHHADALFDYDHGNGADHELHESDAGFHRAGGDSAVHDYCAECGRADERARGKWRRGCRQHQSEQRISISGRRDHSGVRLDFSVGGDFPDLFIHAEWIGFTDPRWASDVVNAEHHDLWPDCDGGASASQTILCIVAADSVVDWHWRRRRKAGQKGVGVDCAFHGERFPVADTGLRKHDEYCQYSEWNHSGK